MLDAGDAGINTFFTTFCFLPHPYLCRAKPALWQFKFCLATRFMLTRFFDFFLIFFLSTSPLQSTGINTLLPFFFLRVEY